MTVLPEESFGLGPVAPTMIGTAARSAASRWSNVAASGSGDHSSTRSLISWQTERVRPEYVQRDAMTDLFVKLDEVFSGVVGSCARLEDGSYEDEHEDELEQRPGSSRQPGARLGAADGLM